VVKTILNVQDGSLIKLTMRRPSNFHAHFRRDALMRAVTPHVVGPMHYVLAMPNNGPIATIKQAEEYHAELMREVDRAKIYTLRQLVMTLYHTSAITPFVVERIAKHRTVRAIKHYPPHPGATTGSGHGVSLEESHEMLRAMEETGVPLLGHFESVFDKDGRELPHRDRETYFVREHLWRLRDKYPALKICFEHASTEDAVRFITADNGGNTVGTFTPQHMLFTEDDFPRVSWRNHLKCMPIVKPEHHRAAVHAFATSGDARAILGDDTAPHLSATKNKPFDECANGCYMPHALALYTLAFQRAGALDSRFEAFASLNGPRWWGLDEPSEQNLITIRAESKRDIPDPTNVPEANDVVIPLGWTTEPDKLKVGFLAEH
jgi:dihydroorotase